MFSLKFENNKKKEAPFSKEQYDYILTDLLNRKAAIAGLKENHGSSGKKARATDEAFMRLIDSIWKEQYTYYKK